MGTTTMTSGSPTVAQWQLARELKRLRSEHKMNRTEVAKILEVTVSSVSRWESAERVPREKELKQLAQYYHLSSQESDELVNLRRQAGKRGWWQSFDLEKRYGTFIGLEADATEIEIYESSVITGLLHTPNYAREVIRGTLQAGEPVDGQVEVRLARQQRVLDENGPEVCVVLGEAAIRQLVGGRQIMREQLQHLIELIDHPKVTLQVIPFSAGVHIGLLMPNFVILTLADFRLSTVYLEGQASNLFLDSHEDVARHKLAFKKLRSAGVSGNLAQSLLADVIKEL
ncbi:helix-turn-helix domain-containing protein [Salinactinospora qingdaonensis]|uniref:helix-turn-helix domain-containing protein n=1 Tax=Salinactinospora qingdaonensis TaxID=702744 RepID=UPI0031E5657C